MEGDAGADVAGDRPRQRLEQEGRLADPVGERRAFELDPGPGVDGALPVKRSMVAILGHQDMGEEAGARPTALDRQRRERGLGDGLAGPTAHLRPDVDHHLEVRGHILQHLALVAADPAELLAAAGRADAGRLVLDPLARQMGGQRLTAPGATLAALGQAPRHGGVLASLLLGRLLFEIADQQLELLEPLGGLAEAGPLHERQRRAQLLDVQRLGVDLGVPRRQFALLGRERRLQRGRERAQGLGIGGQRSGCRRHAFFYHEATVAAT
jgi:hypothetical protein